MEEILHQLVYGLSHCNPIIYSTGPYQTEVEMGVSENSVPLNPMVLLIIIPFLNGYFIGNIPYFQTHPYGDS